MPNQAMDNKNIIQCKAVIDENCKIISSDEFFYRFAGLNVTMITDAIHQVDIDDFIYVLDNLNTFAPKNMVIRFRRFDNSFRWCLATITKSDVEIDGSAHITVDIEDIVNMHNHYMVLTKDAVEVKNEQTFYGLEAAESVLALAKHEIDEVVDNQVNLIYIGIDNIADIKKQLGEEFFANMLNEIATDLVGFVGERGMVAHCEEGRYLIFFRNVGSESNLRSFIESTRSKIRLMYISKNSAFNIKFTIATSEYPRNGSSFEVIEKKLNYAYEYALNKGGNCYVIYKEDIHGEI